MTIQDREKVAGRLLRASERLSYDPAKDIDWNAPLDPTLYATPAHRVSLFGTPLWDELDDLQRIQLSWHEFASTASVGLWFEIILMQGLLRYAYDQDPGSQHVQYCLTEIGDETRHSVMFARAAEKLAPGARYRPTRLIHQLGRLYKTVAAGPSLFASVLVAEETLDRLQRELMETPNLLPLSQQVAKIHVTEEARHVAYARSAVERQMPKLNPTQREMHKVLTAVTSICVVESFIDPAVYTAVGLDPKRAVAEVRNSQHQKENRLWMADRVTTFLRDADVISGPVTKVWRKAGLVA
jgi:hypothetical protein